MDAPPRRRCGSRPGWSVPREPNFRRDVLFGCKWTAARGAREPVRAAPGEDKAER